MLGATELASVLGAGVDPADHAAMREYIRSCCKLGLHVLLIKPGTKEPFDGRTPRVKNAADKKARDEAREAGKRGWAKMRSPSGLALASKDPKVFLKVNGYVDEYIRVFGDDAAINLAIEVGESGLIVVDCDTTEQRELFLEIAGADQALPPTVITPGTVREGKTIHYDGGHYYFTVPTDWRDNRPTNIGAFTWAGPDGFAVLWDRRYVLIPPSIRPEGVYELVGRDYTAPQWLLDEIERRAEARAARSENMSENFGGENSLLPAIDEWAEATSWNSILEPLGWVPTSRTDACGCETWTAPGDHASEKSATAHDSGCSLGRYTVVNAPLHIWTDHDIEPFDAYVHDSNGATTLSKLQAVAYSSYEGNVGKAMDGLEIAGDPVTIAKNRIDSEAGGSDPTEDIAIPEQPFDLPATNGDEVCSWCTGKHSGGPEHCPRADDEDDDDAFPGTESPDENIFESEIPGLPIIAPFTYWRDMPPPEYIVAGLIEHASTSCLIGAPGAGKSAIALDMACAIATGRPWQGRKTMRTNVIYLPGEGLSGTVQRIKAWGRMHDVPDEAIAEGLLIGNDILRVTASAEAWGEFAQYVVDNRVGLIIFDTFARTATGLEENSATDVGRAIFRFDQVRKLTNAGVMIVHHTAKGNPSSGRGSSALNAALESELLVRAVETTFISGNSDPKKGEITEDRREAAYGDGVIFDSPAGVRPIEIEVTKQKNAPMPEDGETIKLSLVECAEFSAPYVASESGNINPMIGTVEMARPIEEPTIEVAVRIRNHVELVPEQGATRSDLQHAVLPDAYTRGRRDADRFWKGKINMAVDLGLRLELIETLTGKETGMRYVPGPVSPAAARAANAAEVLKDPDDQD